MLVFKNNIYEPKGSTARFFPTGKEASFFDPYQFIHNSLIEDLSLFTFIEKQPEIFRKDDIISFFPSSHKCINWPILNKIIRILIEGLKCKKHWYHMNTYHFCILYDVLKRNAFNYNHDCLEEKILFLPELGGEPIQFDAFMEDYFFNRFFLMDPDEFNSLSSEDKLNKGFSCPCQFGVINGLIPNNEEMTLKQSKDYPYTIVV